MNHAKHLALVLAITATAACGSVELTTDAGPSIDGAGTGIDAAQIGVVQVFIYDQSGVAQVGLPVAFVNADGSSANQTTTDSNGTAKASMSSGGSVTVGALAQAPNSSNSSPTVYTWLDVQPGDTLLVNVPSNAGAPFTGTINVSPVSGATEYSATGSCGSGTVSSNLGAVQVAIPMSFNAGCTSSSFVVVASGGITNGPIQGFYAPAQAVSSGVNLDLTNSFVPLVSTTVNFTNVPASVTSATAELLLADGDTPLFDASSPGTFSGAAGSATMSMVNAGGADVVSFVAAGGSNASQLALNRGSSLANLSLDLTAERLLSVTPPVYDKSTSSVTWTEVGNGAPNMIFLGLTVVTGSERDFTWNIVAPYTAGGQVIPTLPANVATFNIAASDTVTIADMSLIRFSGGYAGLHSRLFALGSPIALVTEAGQQAIVNSHFAN